MKMHWRRFLVFNAAGGILWATVVGVGFYYFASALKTLRAPLDIAIGLSPRSLSLAGSSCCGARRSSSGRRRNALIQDRWTDGLLAS